MMIIINIFISIIVIALVSLIQNAINLKKTRRARQILLPFIAGLFGVVAMIIGYTKIDELGTWFGEEHFLFNSEIAICNLLIIALFIVIKIFLCPIFSSLCKKKKFLEATTSSFYVYDEQYEEWFLLHKWVNFRKQCLSIG